MARFSIAMRKRRKAMAGSFHNQVEAVNTSFNRRANRQPLGLVRTISTALSLSFGAMMCYVAMHYLPAFLQPQKILHGSEYENTAIRLENKGPIRKIFGPYIDALSMKRTYLRSGQEISAHYILPEGAQLSLTVSHCKPIIIVEIFDCQLISQKNITVTDETIGSRGLQFAEAGFYHFDHEITFADDKIGKYNIVWSRK